MASLPCAWAHVDEFAPQDAAATIQLLSWGVGGDDCEIQALPRSTRDGVSVYSVICRGWHAPPGRD